MIEQQHVSKKLNFDSTGDIRRSPITAIPGSSNTCECSDAWFVSNFRVCLNNNMCRGN